jgi:hypothetical protein
MKKLFDYLASNNVTPNGYYVLHSIKNNYHHINYINLRTEQHRLTLSEFIYEEDGKFLLTQKAKQLLDAVDKIDLSIEKRVKKVPIGTWEKEIAEFNNLFPKGRRDGSSTAYRTNPKELHERFCWFFKEYPNYNWELVLEMTKKYVEIFNESGDYRYMQSSKYFIKKQDKNMEVTSTLASMCWNKLEGNDEELSSQNFHYFGP